MTSEAIRKLYIDLATSNDDSETTGVTMAYMRTFDGYTFCQQATGRDEVVAAAAKWWLVGDAGADILQQRPHCVSHWSIPAMMQTSGR